VPGKKAISCQLSAIGGVFVVLNQPHSNPVQPTPTAGEAESSRLTADS